jgi:aminomethyltransferase
LWELGLDFTVSPGKAGFRGAEEHLRLKGRERFRIFGLLVDADGPVGAGDAVMAGERKVGVVTCPCYSKLTGRSMAIMRVGVEYAQQGTKLRVEGRNVKAGAIAHTITFDDPEKKKRTAVG